MTRLAVPILRTSVLLFALAATACKGEAPAHASEAPAKPPTAAELQALAPALRTYADIAQAAYADSASEARKLLAAIDALAASPGDATLAATRKAWLAARHPYQQTEPLRFYDGPIDRTELLINTWPIDENFVEGAADSGARGIVDDEQKYPELSAGLLSSLNAKDGETSISTGYHVIEFLLWGKDTNPDGPGARPAGDYDPKSSPLAERRARYLRLSTELLISELDELVQAWAPDRADNYRSRFLAMPSLDAFALAVKGMGALSGPELAGERLTVAYETKDQENEHSCFSDNTQQDLADNGLGLQNVCSGRYTRMDGSTLSGAGLCAAIAVRDRALGERLEREITASLTALRAIPAPFDRALAGNDETPSRKAVQSAIKALTAQTATLAKVAARYDLKLSFPAAKGGP